eukprot:TRINITY_DN9744_c0_g1_i1.p1 TRINITY_DN9744_c0_g1~~TRINITY_DN9744_c0_g1_i1.p1  ORF type:complete len:557 (+),score=98.75 TRINITY_DN9744_c0_g1_i1:222-1892(+)
MSPFLKWANKNTDASVSCLFIYEEDCRYDGPSVFASAASPSFSENQTTADSVPDLFLASLSSCQSSSLPLSPTSFRTSKSTLSHRITRDRHSRKTSQTRASSPSWVVEGREISGRDITGGERSLHDLGFASLSVVRDVGSMMARVGRGEQRTGRLRWLQGHGRALMLQIPLLERAGIGALAGGLAGGFTNATLHPIDTVKTKLQTRGSSNMYKGPIDVVQKVLAKQGVAGFYRGLPAALVGSMVSSSIYFGMYELGKGALSTLVRCPVALVPPLAAALGNVCSSAILVPKEVIKQRMQAGAAGTAVQVMLRTVRAEGLGGLYAGYAAALLRNLPSNMLNFSTFEYMKAAWLVRSGGAALQPWESIISGAVAGSLSAALTTPLDVVKTRLMTQARQAVLASGATPGTRAEAAARAQAIAAYTYGGVIATLERIWREEGHRGLMRGMGPRIVYSAAFSAVGFLSFETCRAFLLKAHLARKEAAEERRSRGAEPRANEIAGRIGEEALLVPSGKEEEQGEGVMRREEERWVKAEPTVVALQQATAHNFDPLPNSGVKGG